MVVHAISPQEQLRSSEEALLKAQRALAEVQVAVSDALATLRMHEHNWRLGWYMQKPAEDWSPGLQVAIGTAIDSAIAAKKGRKAK